MRKTLPVANDDSMNDEPVPGDDPPTDTDVSETAEGAADSVGQTI